MSGRAEGRQSQTHGVAECFMKRTAAQHFGKGGTKCSTRSSGGPVP